MPRHTIQALSALLRRCLRGGGGGTEPRSWIGGGERCVGVGDGVLGMIRERGSFWAMFLPCRRGGSALGRRVVLGGGGWFSLLYNVLCVPLGGTVPKAGCLNDGRP
jgi:hypothetical protein